MLDNLHLDKQYITYICMSNNKINVIFTFGVKSRSENIPTPSLFAYFNVLLIYPILSVYTQ